MTYLEIGLSIALAVTCYTSFCGFISFHRVSLQCRQLLNGATLFHEINGPRMQRAVDAAASWAIGASPVPIPPTLRREFWAMLALAVDKMFFHYREETMREVTGDNLQPPREVSV